LCQIATAGKDLAVRIISIPGAPRALSQAALHCSDVDIAHNAASVLAIAAGVGPEHAAETATPDVLAALVSASGRVGRGESCMAALGNLAGASLSLALRVADTPGAEAAMLAALTHGALVAASNAIDTLCYIMRADEARIACLLSAPEVPVALARLLQSDNATAVAASTCEGLNMLVLAVVFLLTAGVDAQAAPAARQPHDRAFGLTIPSHPKTYP
jgi:hypothetical protein